MRFLVVLILTCTVPREVFGEVVLDTYRSFSVYNGDSLVLWCTDRDLRTLQGQVSLTWVKDNAQIPNNDPRLNTVANGTLSLQQIRKIDAGEYTCTLTADRFLSTNSTRLFVTGNDPPNSGTSSSVTMEAVTASSVTQAIITTSSVTPTNVTPTSVITSGVTPTSVITSGVTPTSIITSGVTPTSIITSGVTPTSIKTNTITSNKITTRSVILGGVTNNSKTLSNAKRSSVTTSTVTLASRQLRVNQTTFSYSPKPTEQRPTPTNIILSTSNRISDLQEQVVALLNGNHSTNVSTVISELVNLTRPGIELRLDTQELSTSLDVLVLLVTLNSELNNSAINTSADQQNIIQVASNLLEEVNSNTWLRLQKSRGNATDDLLKTMDDFASQVSSQLDGSVASAAVVMLSKNIAFRVDRVNSRKMLNIDLSSYGTSLSVPDAVFSDTKSSRVSAIVYRTLHKVLRLRNEGPGDDTSGSNIISALILPRPKNPLRKEIKLVFSHINQSGDFIGKCVFWEIGVSQRTWNTSGCTRVESESNSSVTTCKCDHLTVFAVLLNNKPGEAPDQPYLEYISIIGCACSLLFLLLTFVVTALCWKQVKSARVTVLLNLCTAIFASCVLIILADYAHDPEVLCTVTAALLHYFLLCVFAWMLCHGAIFYFLIIRAELRENLQPKMKWFYALGWGFPLPIVAASLALTRAGTKPLTVDNCWLPVEHGIIYWAFVAPVVLVVLINSVLFIFLLRRISRVTKFREINMARANHMRAWIRRSVMLLPVLGVTWSFGFLTFVSSTLVFHYLFTILNSLQGFFIFLNFCILDDRVKEALSSTWCKRNTTSLKEQVELAERHAHRRHTSPTVATAIKTDGKQNQGFLDLTERKIKPKFQTWMSVE